MKEMGAGFELAEPFVKKSPENVETGVAGNHVVGRDQPESVLHGGGNQNTVKRIVVNAGKQGARARNGKINR